MIVGNVDAAVKYVFFMVQWMFFYVCIPFVLLYNNKISSYMLLAKIDPCAFIAYHLMLKNCQEIMGPD